MGQTTSQNSQPSPPSASGCPIAHERPKATTNSRVGCPVHHRDGVNPKNNMPELSQDAAPGQDVSLPTERTMSTIPRDDGQNWVYPSPQQFQNALVRKGMPAPPEYVQVMVDIHNLLNEKAWEEVLKWEQRQYGFNDVQLMRLRGRPGELSPKARFWLLAGWLLPSRFNADPPFDRHDWVVRRPRTGEQVRYVIDYYSSPPDSDGSPTCTLDVRPALDSFGSIKERISLATSEVWSAFKQNNSEVPSQ